MKYFKRLKIFKDYSGKNTFNPATFEAHSYSWWRYVMPYKGKLIFNAYRYSPTTGKHQSNMRGLLNELGMRIDVTVKTVKSLSPESMAERLPEAYQELYTLLAMETRPRFKPRNYAKAELQAEIDGLESLGFKVTTKQLKAIEHEVISNEMTRQYQQLVNRDENSFISKLTDYLENSVCFRDYEIRPASDFGTYNKVAVHQVVERESLERDVENALHNFHRDGFGNVVFYV